MYATKEVKQDYIQKLMDVIPSAELSQDDVSEIVMNFTALVLTICHRTPADFVEFMQEYHQKNPPEMIQNFCEHGGH